VQIACKPQDVPSCCGCGSVITDDTKALQCDRCASTDSWKCAECLHLTDDMYDHLVSDSKVTLKWFCESCDKTVMDKGSPAGQKEKLDHLLSVTEKIDTRIKQLEEKLGALGNQLEARITAVEEHMKPVNAVIEKLDSKIKQLEENFGSLDNQLEARISAVEHHMKPLNAATASEKENAIPDEELLKHAIQEEVNRKVEEEKDLEKRRKNIIMYRVPEKKTDDVSERKNSDEVFVKDLLDGVFNMKMYDGDIERMYRLGRWSEDKARPLLVTLKNADQKDFIMANLKNLRQPIEKFKGIGISHDLHPKEREERRRLVEEAKQDHVANASDNVGNYRFIVVGNGQRRKVIKIKRNNTAA